jgi:hypothetical protein
VLRNPSPALTPDITPREKRYARLQQKVAAEPVFGMRHRY